ncbi:hypothetical protein KTR66_19465 [Roseococcus sp. SDR]|uniref:WYL domain-containing protein n=1 Tax=Roseococcus sp. SDR TaxID=2835532 RepID=UPI001BCF4797|nr:hypothetical protein [Roseococcus sp. SDR]MBS7792187.1 hypothetical protein [Roseococcus sp. SDR]MBV1847501.1 hypothetical protein [Roseococcus sp. SDR]
MDPVWVVLALLVGAFLFLGALKRTPRDDQRRIPYTPDRRNPAIPPEAPAPPPRQRPDIFDLRQPATIRILYIDAEDEETERQVDVKSFTIQGGPTGQPTHLRGRCHLRQASRAFALRRIEEAFDMRDGAEIPDVGAWLLAQPSRRRPRDLDL